MTSSIGRSTFSEPSSLTSLLKIMLTGSSASIVASAVRVCSELLPSLPPAAVATAFNTLYGGGGDVASFINFLLAAVAKGLSPWTSVSNAVAPLASRSRGDFLSAQAAELVQVRASFFVCLCRFSPRLWCRLSRKARGVLSDCLVLALDVLRAPAPFVALQLLRELVVADGWSTEVTAILHNAASGLQRAVVAVKNAIESQRRLSDADEVVCTAACRKRRWVTVACWCPWRVNRQAFVRCLSQDVRRAIATGLAGLAVVGGTVSGLRVGGTANREGQQDVVCCAASFVLIGNASCCSVR